MAETINPQELIAAGALAVKEEASKGLSPASDSDKVKLRRRAGGSSNGKKTKAAKVPLSVVQPPIVASAPAIPSAPQEENARYKAEEVFSEQIVEEQSARNDSIKSGLDEGTFDVLPQEERDPYKLGDVSAEQILEEQEKDAKENSQQLIQRDLTSNANEINAARLKQIQEESGEIAFVTGENVSVAPNIENAEVLAAFGKTPERVEIEKINSQIRELYYEKKDKDGKIIEGGKLVDARRAYAEAEYRNVGVWQRLTEKLGVRKKESDSVAERGKYNQVLQTLITLRIEKLKHQPELSPEDLKKAMAEELQFFGTESKIKLYEAWTQATMKRESFPAKAVGLCEDLGNEYNKLPLWQKLGLGALAIGTSVATGGGAAAMGLVATRRVAAGLGTFAMTEGILEKISQGRASNVVKNKTGKLIDEVKEGDAEKQLKQLMKTLKGEMNKENLRQELHDRARGKSLRTITAAVVSFGAMFGIPYAADHIKEAYFGTEVVEKASGVVKNAAVTAVEQKIVHSGEVTSVIAEKIPSGPVIQEHVQELMKDPARLETLKVLDEAKALREMPAVYDVVKGDNTWKILDGYLTDHDLTFAGMSEGQQSHAIDALKDKLKLFTPAQLKEAGFTSGNIDKLRVGDTINLDKLIGIADADKVITGAGNISTATQHSIEANNLKIADWAKAHPGEAINDRVIDEKILGKGGVHGSTIHGRGSVPELLNSFDDESANRLLNRPPVSNIDASVTQLQGEMATLKTELASTRELLRGVAIQPRVDGWIGPMLAAVPEGTPSMITTAEFKKIPLGEIQKAIQSGSYADLNLTAGQFENIKQFIAGAEKDTLAPKFDKLAQINPRSNIGGYITKIALDPRIKPGFMIGGRGGFSTSI